MRIIRRRKRRFLLPLLLLFAVLGGYSYWALARPLPAIQPLAGQTEFKASPEKPILAWPTKGQAAVGILDTDIMETHGTQSPAPIASAAKLITALTILREKPLKTGQPGPIITLTAKDVDIYHAYVAQHGSVVPVAAGEQISQYQMLQAIMLPSANNMADSLAIWAFGSLNAYATAANDYMRELGLKNTKLGSDASGLAPSSVSTAYDLVKLGKTAMRNPVLAGIVSQETASGLPIVNDVKNVNYLLGGDYIIGIKTGNTDEAGGVFVSASQPTINGKPVTIITAIVGEASLFTAMKSSQTLIRSAQANFSHVTIVKASTPVGSYKQPWGGNITAVASEDLDVTTWKGDRPRAYPKISPIFTDTPGGKVIGSINTASSPIYNKKSAPIKLKNTPTKPTTWWRLTHP